MCSQSNVESVFFASINTNRKARIAPGLRFSLSWVKGVTLLLRYTFVTAGAEDEGIIISILKDEIAGFGIIQVCVIDTVHAVNLTLNVHCDNFFLSYDHIYLRKFIGGFYDHVPDPRTGAL
jgi:hypothetical protein